MTINVRAVIRALEHVGAAPIPMPWAICPPGQDDMLDLRHGLVWRITHEAVGVTDHDPHFRPVSPATLRTLTLAGEILMHRAQQLDLNLQTVRRAAQINAGEAIGSAEVASPLPPPPSASELGRAGAREGMDRATTHADAIEPTWSDRAYALVLLVASRRVPFTCPDVRAHARAVGLPDPPNNRAWGGVVYRAARAGLIRKTGRFHPYGDATTHTTDVAEWKAA